MSQTVRQPDTSIKSYLLPARRQNFLVASCQLPSSRSGIRSPQHTLWTIASAFGDRSKTPNERNTLFAYSQAAMPKSGSPMIDRSRLFEATSPPIKTPFTTLQETRHPLCFQRRQPNDRSRSFESHKPHNQNNLETDRRLWEMEDARDPRNGHCRITSRQQLSERPQEGIQGGGWDALRLVVMQQLRHPAV